MKPKKKSTKQLKDEYLTYYNAIYITQCFGTKDLRMLDHIETELEKRGVAVMTQPLFVEVSS